MPKELKGCGSASLPPERDRDMHQTGRGRVRETERQREREGQRNREGQRGREKQGHRKRERESES